jgi:hypothetical protein
METMTDMDNIHEVERLAKVCEIQAREIAELRQQLAGIEVSEGWQMVPVDISNYLLFREELHRRFGLSFGATKDAWASLLKAAPTRKPT